MAEMIDRRAVRSRRALHAALMTLILRKGYEAITVQDIIDEADVGRSTFYAHYTGKEDLLRSGFQTLRAELAAAQTSAGTGKDGPPGEPLGFSRTMFEHAGEYKQAVRALGSGRGGAIAAQEIRNALLTIVKKDLSNARDSAALPDEVRTEFVVGAFLTMLAWWLERKPRLAASEVDRMFRHLVLNGIGGSSGATPRAG